MWSTVWSILSVLLALGSAWDISEPMESIQGTYEIVQMKISENPPMLASIWDIIGQDFTVSAWPPKYCHAIHICFVSSIVRSTGTFHANKTICNDQFVKWYPHISRLDVKLTPTGKIEKTTSQLSTLFFENLGNDNYKLETTNGVITNRADWEKRKPKYVQFNLKGKLILLLTNSRFCFAHVTQPKSSNQYFSLFSPKHYKGPFSLPVYLTSHAEPTGHPSIFRPPITVPSTKRVDLLAYVKTMKKIDPSKMRQRQTCSSYRTISTNSLKKSIGVVAADSWVADLGNTVAPKRVESFFVSIGKQCSWLRVWISANPADNMDTYVKNMKLEETIDLFFDQQFFVAPDSDEARPLNGDSSNIGFISFRRFPVTGTKNEDRVVEMSYGRNRSPVFPFIEYFHMPSYHGGATRGTSFRVTLIKAPECEAVLVPGSDLIRLSSADEAETNPMSFQSCEHVLFKES